MSLYVYVCECESLCVCVQFRRCFLIWLCLSVGQVKDVPVCSNKIRTNGKTCVSQVEGGQMWVESNTYSWEDLWFV